MSAHTRCLVLAVALASMLALAGCTPETESSDVARSDASTALLNETYEGVVGTPPSQSVSVTDGVTFWQVSCGEASVACATPAAAAVAAAESVGWSASVCDGKLAPDGWSACIRQGIAAGADVISLIGVDCAPIAGALGEAAAAGVVTIGVSAEDCDAVGGTKLFSATTQQLPDVSLEDWWKRVGALQAGWLIGRNDGAAKILKVVFPDPSFGPLVAEGIDDTVAEHPDSEVVSTLEIGNSDVVSGALVSKFSTALTENPDINAIAIPNDSWLVAGLAQAIESSGRSSEISVIGMFGSPANFDLIRAGIGQDATVAWSSSWDGYTAVDAALRVLAKQPVQPGGLGMQVVDADHNLPAEGAPFDFDPAIDYARDYAAAWGR